TMMPFRHPAMAAMRSRTSSMMSSTFMSAVRVYVAKVVKKSLPLTLVRRRSDASCAPRRPQVPAGCRRGIFKLRYRMKRFLFVCLLVALAVPVSRAREVYDIGRGWKFYTADWRDSVRVDLPHTWNDSDAAVGRVDYYR